MLWWWWKTDGGDSDLSYLSVYLSVCVDQAGRSPCSHHPLLSLKTPILGVFVYVMLYCIALNRDRIGLDCLGLDRT